LPVGRNQMFSREGDLKDAHIALAKFSARCDVSAVGRDITGKLNRCSCPCNTAIVEERNLIV